MFTTLDYGCYESHYLRATKLADDNTIDYKWTSGCIFLQQLIDIMCASDTSESQYDDDTAQSTEVDNMIDVVYEDETDDEANF